MGRVRCINAPASLSLPRLKRLEGARIHCHGALRGRHRPNQKTLSPPVQLLGRFCSRAAPVRRSALFPSLGTRSERCHRCSRATQNAAFPTPSMRHGHCLAKVLRKIRPIDAPLRDRFRPKLLRARGRVRRRHRGAGMATAARSAILPRHRPCSRHTSGRLLGSPLW